jgi:aminopeptidase N
MRTLRGLMPGLRRSLGPFVSNRAAWAGALALFFAGAVRTQEQRPLIDVQSYDIDATVEPGAQVLAATAQVRFIPRDQTSQVIFELHNNLNVTSVKTADGIELQPLRYRQDSTVRLSFPDTLPVGEPVTLTFRYDGRLSGVENSPVEGLSLASIDPDRSFLLYPARWFPVNGFGADQFTARIQIAAPEGFKVIGSGLASAGTAEGGRVKHTFEFKQASFPGSIAILRDEPVTAETSGITTTVYFHSVESDLAREYGETTGAIVEFLSGKFGAPYSSSLTLVETGENFPEGYAAPGILFFNPYTIGAVVNRRALGTEVAHQWWRLIVSPGNRNHLWLDHGLAIYSALLEIEESQGKEAFETAVSDVRIESLTYEDIPIIQAGRLEDFSPELDALAGGKGAMVLHMLRWTIGDDAFFATLKQLREKFEWRSTTTRDLQDIAQEVSGKELQAFFIQWTESTGTPEFTQEYTIYRLGQGKGFRVLGKVKQDMDTFRMPVELKIETEGEPEYQTVEVAGTSSDYTIDTFGKPKKVILDPNNRILRFDEKIRVLVAIRKGEQLYKFGYYNESLAEYQKALDINRYSSLAHYRIGEVFFRQNNYQSAANEFRESLNGDQEPAWTEVWAHINLGMIFDITDQRERAVNEYQLAIRTRDNTGGAQDEARKYLESPYVRPRRTERIY